MPCACAFLPQILASLGHESGTAAVGQHSRKAERVRALTNINVEASTGKPTREREVRLYCTLQPGYYTVLTAPYLLGMEGPYTLTLHSNFPVHLQTLWPPIVEIEAPESKNKREMLERKLRGWMDSAKARFRRAVPPDEVCVAPTQQNPQPCCTSAPAIILSHTMAHDFTRLCPTCLL